MRAPRLSIGLGSFLVALALVVAVGVGSAIAVIPDNGIYSACLTKATGEIRVVNYPKVKCAKGEQLIKWNAKGPVGPQGPAGAQGEQGPKGDQGPAGPADWNAIGNKPAGFADGVDDIGNPGYVTQTVPCLSELVYFQNVPRNMAHEFQVLPSPGIYVSIDSEQWSLQPGGELRADLLINDYGAGGAANCQVRMISFTQGINFAKAKKQLAEVEVGYAKRPPKRR